MFIAYLPNQSFALDHPMFDLLSLAWSVSLHNCVGIGAIKCDIYYIFPSFKCQCTLATYLPCPKQKNIINVKVEVVNKACPGSPLNVALFLPCGTPS